MGLRVGMELDVLQCRGRGVVVASAGTRVALGSGVAEKLFVVPLARQADAAARNALDESAVAT